MSYIGRVLNKTQNFLVNGTFPLKYIRRDLAKMRLILEQPLTPVLR